MLIGDSHVRRLQLVGVMDFFRRRGWVLTCIARGGANVHFLNQSIPRADMAVIMIGSNDIDNGSSAHDLMCKIYHNAMKYIELGLVKHVIVMGLWPRNSYVFNRYATYFNALGHALRGDRHVTFWQWSRKLTIRLSYDGVHGLPVVYMRAIRYVLAPVLWVSKTKLRSMYF